MIHEQICTCEVCKLAKEKGFDWKCLNYYNRDEKLMVVKLFVIEYTNSQCDEGYITAPTQSLLQRWLREEKDIDIAIVPLYTGGYSYIVYNIHCRDNRVVNTNAGYATYELALEDALKYALENLV